MRPVIWLCLLVTSYFYCLPLGRFTLVGIASDFRIFDFVVLAFWLVNWNYLTAGLNFIYSKRQLATHYVKYLMIIILISLIFNFIFRGSSYIGPTLIRTYRFMAYLSTLVAVIAIVDNRQKFKLLLTVFFINILVQAVLAFLQGIGVLNSFWPDYWREMYSFMDSPVATLSPHHKHIAIVMLMGFSLAVALLFYSRNLLVKLFFAVCALLMVIVPLMSGTRTFVLGMTGVVLALLWITRGRSIGIALFLGIGLLVVSRNLPEEVSEVTLERINEKYEERVLRGYERGGVERLAVERTVIYESVFRAIGNYPYLLITGSGFQAASVFIFGNGAHNNFLQFLIETGLIGLSVFLLFLFTMSKNLLAAGRYMRYSFENSIARFVWIGLIGLIFTMFVGETFYAQAAMFTLTGQIMVFLGLGIAPFFWQSIIRDGVPVYK
ncbi:MAG: O-antigen ligase family protein [Cyclobacteriaceae bacterium]|nr:MAG: O-antigen ligase family protein [Cyclobacteriaceae bacterium]